MNMSLKDVLMFVFMQFIIFFSIGMIIGSMIERSVSVSQIYGHDFVIVEKTMREGDKFSYHAMRGGKNYKFHTPDELNLGDVISMRKK